MSNYPPGVTDMDDHFDLPSAGDAEGDGELCEHGNLIDDEFCDECAEEHWKLSESFGPLEQP